MVKISHVNNAHCKNETCILKRRENVFYSFFNMVEFLKLQHNL